MIYAWTERGKVTMRGDRWHIVARHVGRCFVRRYSPGDQMGWAFGMAWRDYHRHQVVAGLIPLNLLMRAGYSCWVFAKKPPPDMTMREMSDLLESR